jgi:hypothetical protein
MAERTRNEQRRIAMRMTERIFGQFRSLGPYLAVELILPGGSIVALLLWTYRNRFAARRAAARIANASFAWLSSSTAGLLGAGSPKAQSGAVSLNVELKNTPECFSMRGDTTIEAANSPIAPILWQGARNEDREGFQTVSAPGPRLSACCGR